jgi:hypothetical protein
LQQLGPLWSPPSYACPFSGITLLFSGRGLCDPLE